ncbi:MAG: hypothetical protein K2Y25_09555 [Pseudomonadaceae bacterium]|jgi:photosystem II stability/assembly factor-like uncharacterized protein|nr:hypothetical protein [Pseudomonadaceae bacterium]
MREPISRRTQRGVSAALLPKPALRARSPLAKAISLLGAFSLLGLFATPVLAESAASAPTTALVMPKAAHSLLLAIAQAGNRLVAVGDRGHVLYSDDQGVSWTQAKVPTRQMLTSVFFVNDKKGWVTGHDSLILATVDGGETWTEQFIDLEREAPLLDIWFKNAQHGFAVGGYGAILETTDGGAHWEDISDRLDNEDQRHLNSITEIKDSGLFAVGEMGSMFRSADWGQTWETVKGPYEGSLFGVSGTTESASVLAYGLRGHLFRSPDFGKSWQEISLKGTNGALEFGLADGVVLKDGSVVVVGHGGSVLKSTDKGHSFSVLNRADRLSLSGVSADDKGNLILVGQGGVHVATSTGAAPQ